MNINITLPAMAKFVTKNTILLFFFPRKSKTATKLLSVTIPTNITTAIHLVISCKI